MNLHRLSNLKSISLIRRFTDQNFLCILRYPDAWM